jgi:hypothetical protein
MKRTHIGSDAVGAGGGRAEPVREGVALSHIPGSVTCHRVARRLAIRRNCKRAERDDRQRQCTTRVRACFSSNSPLFLPRRNAQPLLRRVCAAANARLRQLQNFSPQPSELDRCQFFALHALQYSLPAGELAVCAQPMGYNLLRRLSSGRTMPVHVETPHRWAQQGSMRKRAGHAPHVSSRPQSSQLFAAPMVEMHFSE